MAILSHPLAGLGAAVLSTACALILATTLRGAPVSFFLCAIAFSAWVGGLWPGLIAVALSELIFDFKFAGFAPSDPDEMSLAGRHLVFALAGLFVVAIGVAHDKATQSSIRAHRALDASLRQVRDLWRRTFQAQDDERRRMSRMLHESTAQDLAILKMHLVRLERTANTMPEEERALLKECAELADQAMTSVRTQSYALYPPFLDESGLLAAIRWFANGFGERSGIDVVLELPDTLERLSQDIETTLFRVVQEALINIHRHANSSDATIRLRRDQNDIRLEIRDHGRGMPAEALARATSSGASMLGIGIAGTRERLEQLGGRLEIESGSRGTTVRAVVPAQKSE